MQQFCTYDFQRKNVKDQKGYKVGPAVNDIVKCAVISIVIIAFMWRLAQYKGIPMILIWVALIVLIYGYLTSKTTVGRHLYAIGGNEKAAQLSGINTNKVYFIAYANMGLLAAVAAMAVIARLNSANPTAGDGYEMDAIGSCFIGGASGLRWKWYNPWSYHRCNSDGCYQPRYVYHGCRCQLAESCKGIVLLAAVIFDVESKKRSK